MFNVLIACYANWDSCVEIPFILKKAGCKIDIYCSRNSWLLSSSYFDNWIHSENEEEKYCANLESLIINNQYDWVILTDDLVINLMNKRLIDEALFCKIMPINKIQNRFLLSSKIGLSKFLVSNKIDTPNFFIYNNVNDLNSIKKNLLFPVVNKIDFSSGGKDMMISHSFEEFQENLIKIPENENTLIQEYLKGEDIQVEGLFYQGHLVSYLSSIAISQMAGVFSVTARRKYFFDEKLKPLLSEIGELIGLNGFVNITYIKYRAIYYLIEVDPRTNSWMAYSRFILENDFIFGVKKIINGQYKNEFHSAITKSETIEVALFYRDILRIINKKKWLDLHRWLFNVNGYWKFIPLYDLKLFHKIILSILKSIYLHYKKKSILCLKALTKH